MKTLAVIACFILHCHCDIYAAPSGADNIQPASTAKPTLRFGAYDGDPKKTVPKDMAFQIMRLDVRQPSQFLKLGNIIKGTKFKLTKFEFKTRPNPKGDEEDVSELTITNVETKEAAILVIGR
jgi:hypothetical protein